MSLISGKQPRSNNSGVSSNKFGTVKNNGSTQNGNKTYADKKAEALKAKNTTVLSIDELERIKGMCSLTNEK
jgi:hypothetical protein